MCPKCKGGRAGQGPPMTKVRDRIDVAIESTNSQVDRRVRLSPLIPAGWRSSLYGPHSAANQARGDFRRFGRVLAGSLIESANFDECRSRGCDAAFAGLAPCHGGKCHRSFADRPAYDAHRVLARPCLHPVVLGVELLGERVWGWAARQVT